VKFLSERIQMIQNQKFVNPAHHFINLGDIELKELAIAVLKKIIVEKEVFSQVSVTCARDNNNCIRGIMGVSGDNLAMLFIHADFIGRGMGKQLLLYAMNDLNITKVDVNEQNEQALKFYERFGFNVISRSETDEMGNPYPILHMRLQ
jgi:putative acetyltransferase